MKVLNVAEKPSVAKEISSILSGGQAQRRQGFSQYNPVYEFPYQIQNQHVQMVFTSVTGHLMELEFDASFRSWYSCDPTELFTAKVTKKTRSDETQKKIEKTLMNEARQSQWLVLWLDCDREGENIAFEVKSVCERASKRLRVFRAKFSALIPRDIVHAVQNLGFPNEKLSLACDARSEIDLRIGAAFTRFQTMRIQNKFPGLKKEKTVISYGPCQFPTLGFVVERFLQIQNFEKEAFYHIDVTHRQDEQPDAPTTTFKWKRERMFDRISCLCIYEALVENPVALVESIDKRPTWKRKPLPLTTVELQKRASRWLRVSSEQTMKAAESLYNKGVLSYPRTETNKFKEGTDLMNLIKIHENNPQWGAYVSQQLIGAGKYEQPRQGGADDQAHPPIHPTKCVALNSLNDEVERKVYEFITLHFLACCSKDAKGHQTNVQMKILEEKFTASGLMIEERNYLDIYKYEKWNASAIPVYQQGDTFTPSTLMMVAGETAPPPLLSESDLISKMDSNGIGTDATIAEHIKTILKREYAEKVNNNTQFQPTTLGLALVLSYEHMGLDLAKPALRAAMEDIFINVSRNAEVLDQTFSEHFKQPVNEHGSNGGSSYNGSSSSGDNAFRSPPAGDDSSRRRRSSASNDLRSVGNTGASRPPPPGRRNSEPYQSDGDQRSNRLLSRSTPHNGSSSSNTSNHGNASASSTSIPRCQDHGLECVEREVAREGPNKGRHFFACSLPQGEQCDHFVWADAVNDVQIKCSGHNEICNERVVKKEGVNKGRTFYACRRDQTETCGFFQWKDELPDQPVPPHRSSSSSSYGGYASSFNSGPPQPDSNAPVPQCPGHRSPCVLRVTKKQGDNFNREFYVCSYPSSESCGYFVWKDELTDQPRGKAHQHQAAIGGGYRVANNNNNNSYGNISAAPQAPTCSCGLPCVLLTSRTDANQGRTFYKCPQQLKDQQCNFFEWIT